MTEYQIKFFQQLSRRTTIQKNIGQRSEIILLHVCGTPKKKIARDLSIDVRTVRKWTTRWDTAAPVMKSIEEQLENTDDRALALHLYQQHLYDILEDAPRPGTPKCFSAEQVAQIVALACELLDSSNEAVSHRTQQQIAEEAVSRGIVPSISQPTICLILKNSSHKAA